jgi:hypothetical protein
MLEVSVPFREVASLMANSTIAAIIRIEGVKIRGPATFQEMSG